MDETNFAIIERLRCENAAVLSECIGSSAGEYALLDFPAHSNVGDSAIWTGEIAALNNIGLPPPALVSTFDLDLNKIERLNPQAPLLIHGGGNFGDIWPRHQEFRESLLERFPGRKVIQLPQSIFFDDARNAERTARAIDRHGAFTLLVRDQPSLEFARAHFSCDARLCPDSAFGLGPQNRRKEPNLDVLLLMRTDKESSVELKAVAERDGWRVADWLEEPAGVERRAWKRAGLRALRRAPLGGLRRRSLWLDYFNAMAEERVERGLAQLSDAKFIITDRLHVHILSLLLNIPHVFLDNRYGKIARFSEAFATRNERAKPVFSVDEAVAEAEGFLGT